MRSFLFSLVLCLFIIPLRLSAQSIGEQDVIREMAAAASAVRSVRCFFTQTRQVKLMRKVMTSKGEMVCVLPDMLRWEYTSPVAGALVMNASEVRFTGALGAKYGERGVAGELARMIMGCVAGRWLTDSGAFQVGTEVSPAEYVATLVPLRKELKRLSSKLVLHYDRGLGTVNRVELYEKNGDCTVISLHDIQINGHIDAESFSLRE